MKPSAIRQIKKLGFPWEKQDPFLFCAHHLDFYPKGNDKLGPDDSLAGRNIGNDFVIKAGWRMYHGDSIPGFPSHPHRGFEIDVVAGIYNGLAAPEPAPDSWAANPKNEVNIWQIKMEENAVWQIPATYTKVNRSLYFFEGETITSETNVIHPNHVLELDANRQITIENGNKPARLLMLQGKPINETVEQYGPFVMNNMTEIEQAFSDYRKTRFGGWPWPRTDMVHGKERGKFAKFDNGKEINMD